ncbi:MAG: hypothetical protein J2P17_33435 [Mycobacterium sp.]|nr:hypothetical protein [Mycobacterium sp.]
MSSTRLHVDPAPPHLLPPPSVQASTSERTHLHHLLPIAALVVTMVGALLAIVGLAHQPSAKSQETPLPPPAAATAPNAAEVAAAKKEACHAWNAASTAIVTIRQPFVDRTQPGSAFDWNDPLITLTLAQAQAGILAQLEYLRGHLAPATPPEVGGPVRDFITATNDVIAADGQHQPAPLTSTAADRFNTAAAKIRAACGA